MRARDEGTTNDNDAWGVRDEWENEAQIKDKKKKKCHKAWGKHDMLGWGNEV